MHAFLPPSVTPLSPSFLSINDRPSTNFDKIACKCRSGDSVHVSDKCIGNPTVIPIDTEIN